MFLPLPFVELPDCRTGMVGFAFDNCIGIASKGARNDGAPPGVPVS